MAEDRNESRTERSTGVRTEVWLLVLLLLVGVAPRLYRLNAPFLDTWWSRDLVGHAVARNYHAKGINLLWPETDFTPDQPNYMGMELPLTPALTAIGWRVFGIRDWVPRSISVLCSLVSIAAFFYLMRRFLSTEGAFAAALLFALSPVNVFLSRKFMNEPLTLCCSLLCMLLFVRWVDGGKLVYLVASGLLGAAAALSKPPIIHFALPLAWYVWHRKGARGFRDPRLYLFAAMVLVPVPFYMRHLASLRETYWGVGTHLQSGMWFSWEQFTSPAVWSLFVDRFTRQILTPFGIVGVVAGAALMRPKFRQWFLVMWLLGCVVYLIAMLGGNARQAYYQLWFVAPCAGIAGYAWQMVKLHVPSPRRLGVVLAGALVVWCAWGTQSYFDSDDSVLRAAEALDEVDPNRSWIIVYPAGHNCLYYLNREGWCGRDVPFPHPWQAPGNPEYIRERADRGARFCLVFTGALALADRDSVIEEYLSRTAPCVYHDPEFDIYRLRKSQE